MNRKKTAYLITQAHIYLNEHFCNPLGDFTCKYAGKECHEHPSFRDDCPVHQAKRYMKMAREETERKG